MYHTILHPTDLSEYHFGLCEKVIALASFFNAKVYFMHVIEPPPAVQIAQGLGFTEVGNVSKEDAMAVLSVLAETFNLSKNQICVEIGSIKTHTIDKARAISADLIILGSHTKSHLPEFLGNTAHAILESSPCDVLTIKV